MILQKNNKLDDPKILKLVRVLLINTPGEFFLSVANSNSSQEQWVNFNKMCLSIYLFYLKAL